MNHLRRREALQWMATALTGMALRPAAFASPSKAKPGPRTEVRRHHGQPQFFLDGQPYTKPVFETYVPQTSYFRQFTAAGTDVFCFSTNLGPGFAAAIWLGPDQFDF